MDFFYFEKNKCIYKNGLGNAHPTLCSTFLLTSYSVIAVSVFSYFEKNKCMYKNGLGNGLPALRLLYFLFVFIISVSVFFYCGEKIIINTKKA
jgi:hypothetical protein